MEKLSHKNIVPGIFFFIMIFFSLACKSGSELEEKPISKPKPVYHINQADPTILYENGLYYLYGTNDKDPDTGFLVYTSADMNNWTLKGYALTELNSFGDWGFWAPQVFKYNNKFYMAYTANENIAIAESNSPLGPFKQTTKKALSSPVKQIDPYIFIDTDGKKYLYHVRLGSGNRIFVAEMTDDFSAIKEETVQECVRAALPWEKKNPNVAVVEGPTVVKYNDLYYLLYSANHYQHPDYAVGYAVSDNVYGPWTKYEGSPIVSKSTIGKPGSGHGDLIKGKNDSLFYVFHTHNSTTSISPRLTAAVKAEFTEDDSGKDKLVIDKQSFYYLMYGN